MNIQLLLTGNEIMSGDIVDSNSAMIADRLAAHGWQIQRKVTLGDDLQQLQQEIADISRRADVLIINGGLGPTVDDLTAQALAAAGGVALKENTQAIDHLNQWCAARNISLNAANRKQAQLPENAAIIANPIGSAVGIELELNNCQIYATPGVPSELKAMLDHELLPKLERRLGSGHHQIRRLPTFGIGESGLQQRLSNSFPDWPDSIELGFRASLPILEVKLSSHNADDAPLLELWTEKLRDFLGDVVLGTEPTSLAEATLSALRRAGKSLATAESCTGGMIASQLTSVAGSSEVFNGGVVSYSNGLKRDLLGVDADTLEQHGAVSEAVARQMCSGALERCGSDLAVAVTGVAGPGGGTDSKPVGTVWIAWGSRQQIYARCLRLPFGRQTFQQWVSAASLDLIRRQAAGLEALPDYLQRYGSR